MPWLADILGDLHFSEEKEEMNGYWGGWGDELGGEEGRYFFL